MQRRIAAKSDLCRLQRGATLATIVLGECWKPYRRLVQFTDERDAADHSTTRSVNVSMQYLFDLGLSRSAEHQIV